ncbi:TniQ family protein [Aquibium microcysteis]|uniref:TniQ family protein n=1 Tax=Aquibium microcysteis TaxID=675281 RepID=UPI00165D0E29|nr:TniQ family protein [Aquibium microcysteis]
MPPRYRRLSQVPKLHDGESLLSFTARIAAANGVTPDVLASAELGMGAQAWPAVLLSQVWALPLACATGVEESDIVARQLCWLSPHVVSMNGHATPRVMIDPIRLRFAPGRFASGAGFHRNLWLVRGITCDPTTGERLREKCTCGHPQLWVTLRTPWKCCRCDQDLSEISPEVGTDEEIYRSRVWAGLLSAKPGVAQKSRKGLPPELQDLSLAAIWHHSLG